MMNSCRKILTSTVVNAEDAGVAHETEREKKRDYVDELFFKEKGFRITYLVQDILHR